MTGYRLINLYDFAAFLSGEAPDAVDLRGVSPYGASGSEFRWWKKKLAKPGPCGMMEHGGGTPILSKLRILP